MSDSATSWTTVLQAPLSSTISWSLLTFMSFESEMLSNHLILYHTLFLLPSVIPSFRVFSKELALPKRWSNCWNFCFSVSPSNEYSGLISFRIDWFGLLPVQETFKNLQHHNLKASVLQHSTLTSIHDYWKNHNFDYRHLCWQIVVSAFLNAV